jgi:hypothetical protein
VAQNRTVVGRPRGIAAASCSHGPRRAPDASQAPLISSSASRRGPGTDGGECILVTLRSASPGPSPTGSRRHELTAGARFLTAVPSSGSGQACQHVQQARRSSLARSTRSRKEIIEPPARAEPHSGCTPRLGAEALRESSAFAECPPQLKRGTVCAAQRPCALARSSSPL